MNASCSGLAAAVLSQPPMVTMRTTPAETSSRTITNRRASCDDAFLRFGCSRTTSSSAMVGRDDTARAERLAPLGVAVDQARQRILRPQLARLVAGGPACALTAGPPASGGRPAS